MLYQLPNGKTIYLSIDEFLNLTDNDVQYLMASNSGESITSPFFGSAMKKNATERIKGDPIPKKPKEPIDDSELDVNIDDLDPDDFPSYEGDNEI